MRHGEEEAANRVARVVMGSSLNSLPDELLVKILSSLPTKQAASTSLLSKRWRTLFTFCHDLDFDDSIYFDNERNHINKIRMRFRRFVDKTLNLQLQQGFVNGNSSSSSRRKFSLKCAEDEHGAVRVNRWICNALKLGVSELHLDLTSQSRINERLFPSKVFTSTTLVKLSVGTRFVIENIPSDTSLPSLKALSLDTIWFDMEDFSFSDVFLSACPVLEELTLVHKHYPGRQYIISSKTIKRLSVTYDCASYIDLCSFITLDTPSLVKLYFSDYALRDYLNCNLDSLQKATLDLHLLKGVNFLEHLDPYVTDLIDCIRNVKSLHLTSSTVEVISVCCRDELPMFKNLVELTFSCNIEQGWKVLLPHLIEHSPNLETLILSGLCSILGSVEICIPENNKVKTLCIKEFRGSLLEATHINQFVKKMESLEVVKVYIASAMDDDPERLERITEFLLKMPAASSKLKIQVM